MEARTRFALVKKGFADLRVTAPPTRHMLITPLIIPDNLLKSTVAMQNTQLMLKK